MSEARNFSSFSTIFRRQINKPHVLQTTVANFALFLVLIFVLIEFVFACVSNLERMHINSACELFKSFKKICLFIFLLFSVGGGGGSGGMRDKKARKETEKWEKVCCWW